MRRARRFSVPSFGTQLTMEVIITTVIIMFTASIISAYSVRINNRVSISASSYEALELWRNYASAYYALNGHWPGNKEDMIGLVIKDSPLITGRFSEDDGGYELDTISEGITFNNGALDVALPSPNDGMVLTLHPAQPYGDSSGPVIWLGGAESYAGWEMAGPDSTTLPLEDIPVTLRLLDDKGRFR